MSPEAKNVSRWAGLGHESGAHVGDGGDGEHDGFFTPGTPFVLDDLSTETHQSDREAAAQCWSELAEQPGSVLGRVDPAAEPAASAIGMGNFGIVARCSTGGPKRGLAPLLAHSMDAAFARSPEPEPRDGCGGPGLVEPTGDSREKVAQQCLGALLDAFDLQFETADLSVELHRRSDATASCERSEWRLRDRFDRGARGRRGLRSDRGSCWPPVEVAVHGW